MHSPITKEGAPWRKLQCNQPWRLVFLGVVVLLAIVVEHSLEDHQLTFYYSYSGAFDDNLHSNFFAAPHHHTFKGNLGLVYSEVVCDEELGDVLHLLWFALCHGEVACVRV
jgi:hypothetical protein